MVTPAAPDNEPGLAPLPWWADNRLTRAARTARRRHQIALIAGGVAAILSLAICALVYWATGMYSSDPTTLAVQLSLPFVIPLILSPILHTWFLNVMAELQERSSRLEREIERRRRVEAQLELLVSTDELTGLPSRRAFFTQAAELTDSTSVVALLDLDHFKRVNDEHGHAAGDDVLRTFARVFAETPGEPVLGRLGGEEFGMVFLDGELDEIVPILDELRERVTAGTDGMTVSIGAVLRRPGDRIDRSLAAADAALYRAKTKGRDRVEVFRDGDTVASERPRIARR